MLIDARTVPEETAVKTDICIVGAGAAGITLARECINRSFQVCLLESGSFQFDYDTQSLYKGAIVGSSYPPLESMQLRFFGGTTNHWGGTCRPLDEIDFERRDWIPYSGWPFDKAHLMPFYKRAQDICQLGPFAYDVYSWEDPKARPRLPFIGDRVTTQMFQFSPPTRFGRLYRDEIVNAKNITTYLYANAISIQTDDDASKVTRLAVATLQGNQFWVKAKLYVLAAGGIENVRLLLLSNNVQKDGLGNQNDLVGRFFMVHPGSHCGSILVSDPRYVGDLYDERHVVNDTPIMGVLIASREVSRREKLINFCVQLKPYEALSAGVRSLARLLGRTSASGTFWQHVQNIITDIDDIAVASYNKITKGKFVGEVRSGFRLRFQLEHAPNPDSRLTLDSDFDALGKNRVSLDLRFGELEKNTMKKAVEIIGQELGRAGIGRLCIPYEKDPAWTPYAVGNGHHIGGTRMHVNPKYGVVNRNCRVHGISNLFISGSSVFPTAGYANPTLTIVSLAVRLADHLKGLLS